MAKAKLHSSRPTQLKFGCGSVSFKLESNARANKSVAIAYSFDKLTAETGVPDLGTVSIGLREFSCALKAETWGCYAQVPEENVQVDHSETEQSGITYQDEGELIAGFKGSGAKRRRRRDQQKNRQKKTDAPLQYVVPDNGHPGQCGWSFYPKNLGWLRYSNSNHIKCAEFWKKNQSGSFEIEIDAEILPKQLHISELTAKEEIKNSLARWYICNFVAPKLVEVIIEEA